MSSSEDQGQESNCWYVAPQKYHAETMLLTRLSVYVELDGDEMTRIIWAMIKEKVRSCPLATFISGFSNLRDVQFIHPYGNTFGISFCEEIWTLMDLATSTLTSSTTIWYKNTHSFPSSAFRQKIIRVPNEEHRVWNAATRPMIRSP